MESAGYDELRQKSYSDYIWCSQNEQKRKIVTVEGAIPPK